MNSTLKRKHLRNQRMRSNSSVGKIFRCMSEAKEAMTYEQIATQTGIGVNYCQTLLSRMTSSDPNFKDEYGNMPILRLDEKALSDTTNQMVSLYTWNYKYGNDELNG